MRRGYRPWARAGPQARPQGRPRPGRCRLRCITAMPTGRPREQVNCFTSQSHCLVLFRGVHVIWTICKARVGAHVMRKACLRKHRLRDRSKFLRPFDLDELERADSLETNQLHGGAPATFMAAKALKWYEAAAGGRGICPLSQDFKQQVSQAPGVPPIEEENPAESQVPGSVWAIVFVPHTCGHLGAVPVGAAGLPDGGHEVLQHHFADQRGRGVWR